MNDYFTFFYVKHFELPMCMKCAIQINLPCLALPTPCRICKMLIILRSKKDHTKCMLLLIYYCCSSEKSFSSHKFFGFPALLCIWTLSNKGCMILRTILSHRGQLRDSYASITEDSNTHWCSRRKNHALRAGALKLFEFEDLTYWK